MDACFFLMTGCHLLLVLIFLSSAVCAARGEELNCPLPILNRRIKDLEAELASGQKMKQEREKKMRELTETMTRIEVRTESFSSFHKTNC